MIIGARSARLLACTAARPRRPRARGRPHDRAGGVGRGARRGRPSPRTRSPVAAALEARSRPPPRLRLRRRRARRGDAALHTTARLEDRAGEVGAVARGTNAAAAADGGPSRGAGCVGADARRLAAEPGVAERPHERPARGAAALADLRDGARPIGRSRRPTRAACAGLRARRRRARAPRRRRGAPALRRRGRRPPARSGRTWSGCYHRAARRRARPTAATARRDHRRWPLAQALAMVRPAPSRTAAEALARLAARRAVHGARRPLWARSRSALAEADATTTAHPGRARHVRATGRTRSTRRSSASPGSRPRWRAPRRRHVGGAVPDLVSVPPAATPPSRRRRRAPRLTGDWARAQLETGACRGHLVPAAAVRRRCVRTESYAAEILETARASAWVACRRVGFCLSTAPSSAATACERRESGSRRREVHREALPSPRP